MSTIEGVLIVYGKPVNFTIITKEAAINAAQGLMWRGMITSYRIEKETEVTGKIIASMETSSPFGKAFQASTEFSKGMQAVQNLHHYDMRLDLQQMEEGLLRLGEERP